MERFSLLRRVAGFSILLVVNAIFFLGTGAALRAQAVQFVPSIVRVAGTAPDPEPVTGPAGNGVATSATLNAPEGVAVDGAGNLFLVDAGNGVVRKVDGNGMISTVAGGGSGTCGDATDASETDVPRRMHCFRHRPRGAWRGWRWIVPAISTLAITGPA